MLKFPKLILALSLVALVAVSSVGYFGGAQPTIDTSLAACVATAPVLEVEPKQVSQDGSFEVHGEDFGELVECDDTGFVGEIEGAQYEPKENISIELRQGSQRWELATVDADQDLTFDEELQLPAGVASGPAAITAQGNQGVVKASISVSAVSGEAQQDDSTTGNEDTANLPDTGGLPLGSVVAGLGIVLIAGGILLKRRMS